jgi:hypothetical protein
MVFCEAELRFLLLFLEKEGPCDACSAFSGGHAPQAPLGRLRRDLGIKLSSAKQNKRFLLLFLEKEGLCDAISGGHAPRPPWVGFAEVWVSNYLLGSRTNAFCFFFWKKKSC